MDGMKTSHGKKAVQYFQQGLGCAQALLCTYADELSVSHNTAVSMSQGYAAGTYQVCGPVMAMHVVLNRVLNGTYPERPYILEGKALKPGTLIDLEFEKRFGSLTCREVRESTPEQKEPICLQVIAVVAELLDEALSHLEDTISDH